MWDVERGERIGAFHLQQRAGREAGERLARLQCRQRALEAAQIEPNGRFLHELSDAAPAAMALAVAPR